MRKELKSKNQKVLADAVRLFMLEANWHRVSAPAGGDGGHRASLFSFASSRKL